MEFSTNSPILAAVIFRVLPDWKALGLGIIATCPMYWR